MADNTNNPASIFNNNYNNSNNNSNESVNQSASTNNELESYLKSLDESIKLLAKEIGTYSQDTARDRLYDQRRNFRNKFNSNKSRLNQSKYITNGSPLDNFLDSFEAQLLDSFGLSDFKKKVQEGLDVFAGDIGVSLKEVPSKLGQELGKHVFESVKDTGFGKKFSESINKFQNKIFDGISNAYKSGVDNYNSNNESSNDPLNNIGDSLKDTASDAIKDKAFDTIKDKASDVIKDKASDVIKDKSFDVIKDKVSDFAGIDSLKGTISNTKIPSIVSKFASSSNGAASAMSGISKVAGVATKSLGIVSVGLIAFQLTLDVISPLLEGSAKVLAAANDSMDRVNKSREEQLKNGQERLEADVRTLVEEPFNILKDAAQELYNAWDSNIRIINATQGYTKDDLQSLIGSYAQRLRDEGLSSVVSSADITENLSKVLDAGLSGTIAEEFAYLATKLNSAIPTQDFFSYADTYASLVANAIKNGASQAEAISYANAQMELFASSVLYASRQLTGGFTTGLQNAESLFEDAVQIAQASRTGNPSEIAGVLTAVSAATGAIAPDLASSMVDAVVSAAIGGNSSEIVALRSLAGVNASNTEFLQQLAENPQKIFSTLFENLADMQSMSDGAYMEVAEGLSSIFGLSMDAFARIDFNYLADAISNMNVSDAALAENMNLLASGETTTTAEQLRMQQINEYMIEEGLSYVLDNAAARAIQQHMWDEQIANELQETTYAVALTGAALEFLEGIRRTIDNLLNLILPFTWGKGIYNVIATAAESSAIENDIKQVLELGKVGSGNTTSLYQLTTRGTNLNLTEDLVTLLGGTSALESSRDFWNSGIWGVLRGNYITRDHMDASDAIADAAAKNNLASASRNYSIDSLYSWGTVGKSTAAFIASGSSLNTEVSSPISSGVSGMISSTDTAKSNMQDKLDKMLSEEYINSFVEAQKSYEDWATSAKNFGITDLNAALSEVGYSEESVRARFQSAEVIAASQYQWERQQKEDAYWENMQEYSIQIVDLVTLQNEVLEDIYTTHQAFYEAWVDYFVKHTAYNEAFVSSSEVSAIQQSEKNESQTAVYALAEALNRNSVDLLMDPTLQTNALLGQILMVVNSIMQQNNKMIQNNTSLPDTYNALVMGLTGKG